MVSAKVIDGVQFLETIEELYQREGLHAISRFVDQEFPVGTVVDLRQGGPHCTLHRICDRAVWRMDGQGSLTDSTLLPRLNPNQELCGIIRVFALSYISDPFQIELYGEKVEAAASTHGADGRLPSM